LPWPFDREYMQLALAIGLIVGACAPLIGTFLVDKHLSLMGDGIGHLAFAGVAGGLLLSISPIWTALAVAVTGALAVELLRTRGRTSGDLALALFFYGGIAAGAVLASRAATQGITVNVVPYLFGSILTVTRSDLWMVTAIGAVIIVSVALAHRAWFTIGLDEESARVMGLPVTALNSLLAVLTAVTIVAATRIVGVLLVAALMVLPVASARLVARSQRQTLVISSVIGVVTVILGLAAARVWGLAPGGTIVLVCAVIFAVVSIARSATHGAPISHH
jgi:ABC-type Mn2+/Zn2+ transport systems, permease components